MVFSVVVLVGADVTNIEALVDCLGHHSILAVVLEIVRTAMAVVALPSVSHRSA